MYMSIIPREAEPSQTVSEESGNGISDPKLYDTVTLYTRDRRASLPL